ncbi:MAG: T9SS type A sorting domain-containing protein [Candidatus Marinimicrobia bacterium]|nr:T9SS type A sorting domain-containing protein [FCB group bacterium]MBL7026184.1 T9SS type A sorting domain-containing protein [Candidatus Neomarinimicrobiota bacterium]
MKNLFCCFSLLAGLSLFGQTATAPSGVGTSESPYQITTLNNLYWITQNSAEWAGGKYYEQTADIDASSTSTWNSGAGFSPIGNNSTNFAASYDGQNHVISGISIVRSTTNYQGLFGYVSGGSIMNLGVTSVNVTGMDFTGALVGKLAGASVTNCHSTGSLIGRVDSGGLVGENAAGSSIVKCYSKVAVTASGSGAERLGGLVGINRAQISYSYSTGSVTAGGYNYIGGLTGRNLDASISNSYSTGNVTGNSKVGGLSGANAHNTTPSVLEYCYSTGSVTANSDKGGLVGYNLDPVTYSFWDKETSGIAGVNASGSPAGTGKTTLEMKTQSTFTDAGWDFTINAEDDDWKLSSVNNGYPQLVWAETVDSSLPVELENFRLKNVKSGIEIRWVTSSEIENQGFIISRKTDETHWTEIASFRTSKALEGQGSTTRSTEYRITDTQVREGSSYSYQLSDIDYAGKRSDHINMVQTITYIIPDNSIIPIVFELKGLYPNPFNPSIILTYDLIESADLVVNIYNMRGELVWNHYQGSHPSGQNYSLSWDGKNLNGDALGSGIYLVNIRAGFQHLTCKVTLLH